MRLNILFFLKYHAESVPKNQNTPLYLGSDLEITTTPAKPGSEIHPKPNLT
jgi:hypothetical protein